MTSISVSGTLFDPCACPAGFSRCAGRCLTRLDQLLTYTEAERQCTQLGAHLAVPRSEEENQCANSGTVVPAWLGITDVLTENRFLGADGCGSVPSVGAMWGFQQPNSFGDQDFVSTGWSRWNDRDGSDLCQSLCQLPLCYQPACD